jgi:quercetin dioxygenase-like cupin family protein
MARHFKSKGYDWLNIPVLAYKEEGTHFKTITRRVLFQGSDSLQTELRYFEIAAGGYSTLERHQHVHVVVIQRGRGAALVGEEIIELGTLDVVEIPPNSWHQFRATGNEPFGFLCMVNVERDRPHRPDPQELADLRGNSKIADFIKI